MWLIAEAKKNNLLLCVSLHVQLSHLWWELEQACQQVQSPSVGHADHNVSDPAVRRLVEQLVEEAHHALCPLASITFHSSKLGGQEVVKLLQDVR